MRVWAAMLHEHYGNSDIAENIVAQWRAEMRDTLYEAGMAGGEQNK